MAIKCRRELLGGLYTGINSQHITMTSKMVLMSLVLFSFILCTYFFPGNLSLCKFCNCFRYKSTVDFMYSRIKLLLVPMPLLMKVEFIRYLNLQSLLSALLIKFSIGHLIVMVSFPFHGMAHFVRSPFSVTMYKLLIH